MAIFDYTILLRRTGRKIIDFVFMSFDMDELSNNTVSASLLMTVVVNCVFEGVVAEDWAVKLMFGQLTEVIIDIFGGDF